MSNWCNVRLVVAGLKTAVTKFALEARSHRRRIFTEDMLHGEGADLSTKRTVQVQANWHHKRYLFQVSGDDGISHFRRLSRHYPGLAFLVVYGDPNSGEAGSAYLRRGRAKCYVLSGDDFEKFMAMQGMPEDSDDPDYDWKYWDAISAAEDHAEAKLAHLIARPPRTKLHPVAHQKTAMPRLHPPRQLRARLHTMKTS